VPPPPNRGVDQVGRYYYETNTAPGGPAFQLRPATRLRIDDADDLAVTVALPFGFRFYDRTYRQVRVSSNGAIVMGGSGDVSYTNTELHDNSQALIAPWWDDHDPGTAGAVYTGISGSAPNRVFTVWWRDVGHNDISAANRVSFQAQLFERTNRIEFHYQDAESGIGITRGGSATIGLGNGDDSDLRYSYNSIESARNRRAIRFTPATCGGRRATHLGTFGPDEFDLIHAGDGWVVVGLDGADVMTLVTGDDVACGGPGVDRIDAGGGNDRVFGGTGNDVVNGRVGVDSLDGEAGNDSIGGGPNNDRCDGGLGRDTYAGCEIARGFP
jgi:Ca2+-binding RTX toxin-like protein